MSQIDLDKIHDVELEILDVIDKFCNENDISYSLYCGTMLGAVRHKGFIPWDDDIDLCMTRPDYNKFIKLWIASNNKDYIIQNKETEPSFSQSFTKIRKNHTAFVQKGDEDKKHHQGIFVDILPIDRIPNGKFNKLLYKWNLMFYLLFTREFVPDKSNIIVKSFSKFLLTVKSSGSSRELSRKKYLKKITKYNNCEDCPWVSANTLDGLRHEMPASMTDDRTEYLFNTKKYKGYSDYDGMLKSWYGDYMQFPPEKDQVWKHQPVFVDFEKNYKER